MSEFLYLTEVIFLALHETGGAHKEECLSQLLEEPQAAMIVALEDLCDQGILSVRKTGESITYGISEKYTELVNANIACFIKYDNFLINIYIVINRKYQIVFT